MFTSKARIYADLAGCKENYILWYFRISTGL